MERAITTIAAPSAVTPSPITRTAGAQVHHHIDGLQVHGHVLPLDVQLE